MPDDPVPTPEGSAQNPAPIPNPTVHVSPDEFPMPHHSATPVIVVTAVIALLIGGAGGYGYLHSQKTKSDADYQSQIAVLKATPTPTPTPAPATGYSLLTSTSNFSFEYPKTWTLMQSGPGDGLPTVNYTALVTDAAAPGALVRQGAVVSAVTHPAGSADATLDNAQKGHQVAVQHSTDVTVGTGKYAAKRSDDGGGLGGTTVYYDILATRKDGQILLLTVSFLITDSSPASATPADVQHLLDTLTVS